MTLYLDPAAFATTMGAVEKPMQMYEQGKMAKARLAEAEREANLRTQIAQNSAASTNAYRQAMLGMNESKLDLPQIKSAVDPQTGQTVLYNALNGSVKGTSGFEETPRQYLTRTSQKSTVTSPVQPTAPKAKEPMQAAPAGSTVAKLATPRASSSPTQSTKSLANLNNNLVNNYRIPNASSLEDFGKPQPIQDTGISEFPESTRYQRMGVDPQGNLVGMPSTTLQTGLATRSASIDAGDALTPVMTDAMGRFRSPKGQAIFSGLSGEYDTTKNPQIGTELAKAIAAKALLQEYVGLQLKKQRPNANVPEAQLLSNIKENYPYINNLNSSMVSSDVRNAATQLQNLMSSYQGLVENISQGKFLGANLTKAQNQAANLKKEIDNFNISNYLPKQRINIPAFDTKQQYTTWYNNLNPMQQTQVRALLEK